MSMFMQKIANSVTTDGAGKFRRLVFWKFVVAQERQVANTEPAS
jgi:hypothetical protein